ncbi:MAG: hypothetical protein AABZ31_12365 [Bdellovibrionota bacterium]
MKKLILITTALIFTSLAAHATCPFSGDRNSKTALVKSALGGSSGTQSGSTK